MKSEVYSWRIDPALRRALEDEARRLGASLAEVLDTIAAAWLAEQRGADAAAEQARLHAAAGKWIGSARAAPRARSTDVPRAVRKRLEEKRARGRL